MTTLANAVYEQFKRDHPYGKDTLLCAACYCRKDRTDFRETPWHGRAARCASCEGDVWRRWAEERTHWELVQAREKLRMWQRYASHLRLRLMIASIPPSADVLTEYERPFVEAVQDRIDVWAWGWSAPLRSVGDSSDPQA